MARETFGQIQKMRSGRFQARFQHPTQPFKDGRRRYVKAPTTFRTKTQAREWLRIQESEIIRGTWHDPDTIHRDETFRQYADSYLSFRQLKPTTVIGYRRVLRNHILPAFGNTLVKDITTSMVRQWLATVAPGAPATRKVAYKVLSAICKQAVLDNILDSNPCLPGMFSRTTSPDAPRKVAIHERQALTREQLYLLAENVPDFLRLPVLVAGITGLRVGEIRGLRVEDVLLDKDKRVWVSVVRTISGDSTQMIIGTPKTASSVRKVPLPHNLGQEILTLCSGKEPHLPLFCKPRAETIPLAYGVVKRNISNTAHRLGFGVITPHDLRHTAASLAISSGAPATVVRDLLGHTTLDMTAHYTHTSHDDLVKAVDILAGD